MNTSTKKKRFLSIRSCLWHGCPDCHPDRGMKLSRTHQSMSELYQMTTIKRKYLLSEGMEYVAIWEHEFRDLLTKNRDVDAFVKTLDLQERLDPRDAFFGGRTNAIKLAHSVGHDEKIHYADFTSLYPFVNKYTKYPVGHPCIVIQNFKDISAYFGMAKVKVLAPRKLFHPVLPQRIGGKLVFTLCRTCALTKNQNQCLCDDDQRAIIGTWCTPELLKAREHGYQILKVYEVYHWDQTTQYDPITRQGGIFENYINLFLKIKQESSGRPAWVKSEEDMERYINDYFLHEGILLDSNNVKENKAMRSLAKLLLNSFWGKFGQRLNMPHTSFFHDAEADKFFQCLTDPHKNVKDFHIVSDDMVQLTWENAEHMVPENLQTNVFIACFTTCNARMHLYQECLEKLNERVLYMDTDSVIYLQGPGDSELPLGDFLGELTSELDDGDHITEFVSGGPKQYAYKTIKGKHVCKIRGFSLNYTNSKLINFDSLKELLVKRPTELTGEDENEDILSRKRKPRRKRTHGTSISLVNSKKITRLKAHRNIYNRVEEKKYQIVYTKRVIQEGTYNTLPFGY